MRVVFSDLDDCLFATARKQPGDLAACRPVSTAPDGSVSGWQNPAQAALWDWLTAFGDVVPVTARTTEALARVQLPPSPHAIWCHGGAVRVQGQEDGRWRAQCQPVFDALRPLWPLLQRALTAVPALGPVRFKITEDSTLGPLGLDLFAPAVERHAALVQAMATDLGGVVRVHTQQDRLTVLPAAIRKEHAVAHVIARLRPAFTVGVGDSLSDLPFLALCDHVVMPRASRAFQALLTPLVTENVQ